MKSNFQPIKYLTNKKLKKKYFWKGPRQNDMS